MTSGAKTPAGPERAMTLRNTNVPTNSVSSRARIETISDGPRRPGFLFEHFAHRTLAREHRGAHHLAQAFRNPSIRRLVPDDRAHDACPAAPLAVVATGDVHLVGRLAVPGPLP